MKCKDIICTTLISALGAGGTAGIFTPLLVEYLSRRDQHFQDQLKFFRDNALPDAIETNSDIDKLYDACLNYSKLHFTKMPEKEIQTSKKSFLNKISSYRNDLYRLKLDFSYFEINTADDDFKSAEGYTDRLTQILSPVDNDSKDLTDQCHENIHDLKKLNKSIVEKIIKLVKEK